MEITVITLPIGYHSVLCSVEGILIAVQEFAITIIDIFFHQGELYG